MLAAGAGGATTGGLTSHKSVLAAGGAGRAGGWMTGGALVIAGAAPHVSSSNSDG